MSYFDWRDYDALAGRERFPEGVGDFPLRGRIAWLRLLSRLLELTAGTVSTSSAEELIDEAFYDFLDAARREPMPKAPAPCCLFISHRKCDVKYAECIAYLAAQRGFQYWLDVHDPSLTAATTAGFPSPAQEILIAAIIEIGLLNSTHVMAVHTATSDKSKWIPYEFGRVRQRRVFAGRSCGWFDTSGATPVAGEYTYLAARTKSEADVISWLDRQQPRPGQPGACRLSGPYWTRGSVPAKCLG